MNTLPQGYRKHQDCKSCPFSRPLCLATPLKLDKRRRARDALPDTRATSPRPPSAPRWQSLARSANLATGTTTVIFAHHHSRLFPFPLPRDFPPHSKPVPISWFVHVAQGGHRGGVHQSKGHDRSCRLLRRSWVQGRVGRIRPGGGGARRRSGASSPSVVKPHPDLRPKATPIARRWTRAQGLSRWLSRRPRRRARRRQGAWRSCWAATFG